MGIGDGRREKVGHVVRGEGPVKAPLTPAKDGYLETKGLHEIRIVGNLDQRQIIGDRGHLEDFIYDRFSLLTEVTTGRSQKC